MGTLSKTADDFQKITLSQWIRFHFSGSDFEYSEALLDAAFSVVARLNPNTPQACVLAWGYIIDAVMALGWTAPEDITQRDIDEQGWEQLVARHFTPATFHTVLAALENAHSSLKGETLDDWRKLCYAKRKAMELLARGLL